MALKGMEPAPNPQQRGGSNKLQLASGKKNRPAILSALKTHTQKTSQQT